MLTPRPANLSSESEDEETPPRQQRTRASPISPTTPPPLRLPPPLSKRTKPNSPLPAGGGGGAAAAAAAPAALPLPLFGAGTPNTGETAREDWVSGEVRKALQNLPVPPHPVRLLSIDHTAYVLTYLTGVPEWTAFDLWSLARELEKTFYTSTRRVVNVSLDLTEHQLCIQTAEKDDMALPGETKEGTATLLASPPPPSALVVNPLVSAAITGSTDSFLMEAWLPLSISVCACIIILSLSLFLCVCVRVSSYSLSLSQVSRIADRMSNIHGPATPCTKLTVQKEQTDNTRDYVSLRVSGLDYMDMPDIDGLRAVCGTKFNALVVDMKSGDVTVFLKLGQ